MTTLFAIALVLGFPNSYGESEISWMGGTVYDFGKIKEADGAATHRFVFRNTGGEPFVVLGAVGRCGCTTATYSEAEVAPGDRPVTVEGLCGALVVNGAVHGLDGGRAERKGGGCPAAPVSLHVCQSPPGRLLVLSAKAHPGSPGAAGRGLPPDSHDRLGAAQMLPAGALL